VVVIIPKCVAADFLMGSFIPTKWYLTGKTVLPAEHLLSYFQTLHEEHPDDEDYTHAIQNICRRIITEGERISKKFSDIAVNQAIIVAAQMEDLEFLSIALSSYPNQLPLNTISTFGKCLANAPFDEFEKMYDERSVRKP
jgi:hypothetical protein